MRTKLFTAAQFTPTEWSTAEEKAKFANHFMNFVEQDFKQTLFQKWFYSRLMNTFGHIAHFNISGFWDTFFTSTEKKVQFLDQTINPWTNFCGDPTFTYSDVERAVAGEIRKGGYLEKYQRQLADETEKSERALLTHLKGKYETAPKRSSHGEAGSVP